MINFIKINIKKWSHLWAIFWCRKLILEDVKNPALTIVTPFPGLASPWVRNLGHEGLARWSPSPHTMRCPFRWPPSSVQSRACFEDSGLHKASTSCLTLPLHWVPCKAGELFSPEPLLTVAAFVSCRRTPRREEWRVKISLPPETLLEMMVDSGAFGSLYFWDQLSSCCNAFSLCRRGCGPCFL